MGGKLLAQATKEPDGLYTLPARSTALVVHSKESAELWHRRFGHLASSSLEKLAEGNMVTGMNVPAKEFAAHSKAICEPCILGKHTREPFGASGSKSTRPLELVHTDVCGPLAVESSGGAKYFVTVLDDFSKLSMVQLAASKGQAASILRNQLARLERLCGQRVGTVC